MQRNGREPVRHSRTVAGTATITSARTPPATAFPMPRIRSAYPVLTLLALAPILHAADNSLSRMKADLYYLAGEECEGRGLKTNGINKAADYIAAQFKAAGLKPAGANDSYFQPFAIKETYLEAGPHKLMLNGPDGKEIDPAVNK